MQNVRYAKLSDKYEIKKIMDEGISQDYYSLEEIEDYIQNENKYLLVCISEDDSPLAAMFCIKGPLKDMCELEHIPYPNETFDGYSDESVAVIYKTAATYIKYRCNGYVKQLFDAYDDIFNNIDHDIRIGLALVLPDGKVPIKKHVDMAGFLPTKYVKSPWSSLKSYCSYCNNEYCQCNGLIYIKENNVEK